MQKQVTVSEMKRTILVRNAVMIEKSSMRSQVVACLARLPWFSGAEELVVSVQQDLDRPLDKSGIN